jgi:hypothetical protein
VLIFTLLSIIHKSLELLTRVVNYLLSERPPKPYESLEQIVALQKMKDESNDDPYDVGGAEYACLVQNLAQSVRDLETGVRCDNKPSRLRRTKLCERWTRSG